MKPRVIITVLLLVGWVLAGRASAESPDDLVVFVNKSSRVKQLSADEIKRYFLRKQTTWEDGGRIICINAKDGSEDREAFRLRVLGMNAPEERRYWEAQKIKGGLAEPPTFSNTLKAVFKIKGSISYAFRKDVKPGLVKIVFSAAP